MRENLTSGSMRGGWGGFGRTSRLLYGLPWSARMPGREVGPYGSSMTDRSVLARHVGTRRSVGSVQGLKHRVPAPNDPDVTRWLDPGEGEEDKDGNLEKQGEALARLLKGSQPRILTGPG